MTDKVKVIIEIPKEIYERCKEYKLWSYDAETLEGVVAQGIPLDNDSERAEVQAYFDGEAYGWEQGRKALIDDVKAEIDKAQEPYKTSTAYDEGVRFGLMLAYQIIDKYKAESEGK